VCPRCRSIVVQSSMPLAVLVLSARFMLRLMRPMSEESFWEVRVCTVPKSAELLCVLCSTLQSFRRTSSARKLQSESKCWVSTFL